MTKGERIKFLREAAGFTQVELAEKLSTTKQNIYKYETDIITNIPSDRIEALAYILNTTPAYIMGWEGIEHDSCSESFRHNISAILQNYDADAFAGVQEAEYDYHFLCSLSENNKPLSLSEAWEASQLVNETIDDLIGLDFSDEDVLEKENTPTLVIEDERTIKFVDLFNQLTESEQDIFLAQLKGVLASR